MTLLYGADEKLLSRNRHGYSAVWDYLRKFEDVNLKDLAACLACMIKAKQCVINFTVKSEKSNTSHAQSNLKMYQVR